MLFYLTQIIQHRRANKIDSLDISIHQEDENGNVYTLKQPLIYEDLIVPVGFESDGASVPRFFWRFVFPPGDVHALRAAFLHDYVYRKHPKGWTKEKADKMFRKVMIEDGCTKHQANKAYIGVMLFGFAAWKQGGKQNA